MTESFNSVLAVCAIKQSNGTGLSSGILCSNERLFFRDRRWEGSQALFRSSHRAVHIHDVGTHASTSIHVCSDARAVLIQWHLCKQLKSCALTNTPRSAVPRDERAMTQHPESQTTGMCCWPRASREARRAPELTAVPVQVSERQSPS